MATNHELDENGDLETSLIPKETDNNFSLEVGQVDVRRNQQSASIYLVSGYSYGSDIENRVLLQANRKQSDYSLRGKNLDRKVSFF